MALHPNRRICVITGSRADYGHLFWLMREIQDDPALELQLIVTGSHLETSFGETYQEIEQHGFNINARIPLEQKDDSRVEITKAMGRGMIGFAEAFKTLNPDIVVILGDRFEIFTAASAALMANLPIAHIHGGEVTEGALDDSLRHAITKLAHAHFAVTQDYGNRIIQMGEAPERVFITGVPGLDNIDQLDLPDQATLEQELGIDLGESFFLVTYHPETIGQHDPARATRELIQALAEFPKHRVLITGVNADPDHQPIKDGFKLYAAQHPTQVHLRTSLGTRLYLAAMKFCSCVIGNSSSGIIEAPALNIPTVNIGNRQKGRLRAPSIIDCSSEHTAIQKAIEKTLGNDFRHSLKNMQPPYGRGGASKDIKNHLKDLNLELISLKKFNDIKPEKAATYGS
jgi:UDP-N-acetylglucosamine 2-epimerase (non-hydrolysing)/GDP/UDP-N,N'-diacetylbacillosamine 2-epimerase (hydrolysing)